jgi:hypothetical protein
MRRRLWGIVLVSLGVAASAPTALAGGRGAGVPIGVSPRQGGVHTSFVLRFSIPDATGTTGPFSVADTVWVNGPHHRGCLGEAARPLRPAAAGTAFKLTLDPSRRHGHWCPGRFSGSLVERRSTVCPPGPQLIVCPLYVVVAPRVLGRFRFTVTPPAKPW